MFPFLSKIQFPLLDKEGLTGVGGGGGNSGVEDNTNLADDISFLNDDSPDDSPDDGKDDNPDESQEDKDKKAIESDENELNQEDEEEEEKEENPDEDEEEKEEKKTLKAKSTKEEDETKDDDPLKEATYSSIKKKYPNFFKDFPGIKSQFFAADAFRRIFPTVEDAKEYKESSEAITSSFEAVKGMVENGEVDNFLSEVKGISDEAYKGFVSNFMPALYGNDKDMYYSIATPIVRTAIKNIYQRGLNNGGAKNGKEDNFGQNLVNAAIVLHHALFESNDVEAEDKPLVASRKDGEEKKNPEKEKFEKERNEFYTNKYNTLQNTVQTSIKATIRGEIKQGLNQGLPKYILDKLVDDIFTEIDRQVGKDEVHINSVNALWKKEQGAGFTGVNKDSIINAVLSRARPLIPVVRKRIASEALKDFRGKINVPKGGEKNERKAVASGGGKQKGEKPNLRDTSKMSDLDILNMD